jgi:hypothetical protein
MQATKHIDHNHIDYEIPQHDPEKLRQYTQFIARECNLRKINIQGGQLEEWRSLLRQSVVMEKYISYLLNVRKWKNEGRETVSIVEVVELLIPCILHLENRVGEKLITIILRKGLDTYRGPKGHYLKFVEDAFQRQILGSETSPSHWKLKYSKDDNNNYRVEPIQVKNRVSRQIITEIDVIIEAAFSDNDNEIKAKLSEAIS